MELDSSGIAVIFALVTPDDVMACGADLQGVQHSTILTWLDCAWRNNLVSLTVRMVVLEIMIRPMLGVGTMTTNATS